MAIRALLTSVSRFRFRHDSQGTWAGGGRLSDTLAQAGADLRHVVRTVVYIIDMAGASLVARAHAEGSGTVRPASTLVQVAGLTPAAARVEFEVTAIVTD